MEQSASRDPQVQALDDATSLTPIIQIKGPKSGATRTKVSVAGDKLVRLGKRRFFRIVGKVERK